MESFVVCIVTKEENRVDSSAIEKTLNRTSFMALSLCFFGQREKSSKPH